MFQYHIIVYRKCKSRKNEVLAFSLGVKAKKNGPKFPLNLFLASQICVCMLTLHIYSFLFSLQLCRPGNLLIFHMSALFTVLCLLYLALSSPSLLHLQSTSEAEPPTASATASTHRHEGMRGLKGEATVSFIVGRPICVLLVSLFV